MNNKGFTLVELLATMALLAVLMIMAVPNVVGVVQRNKNKTYIEDAKKLVSLAEYKVRSNPTQYKPGSGQKFCFSLSFLGVGNFDQGPNGGKYQSTNSFVIVENSSSELKYIVTLVEEKTTDNYIGISNKDNSLLYSDDSTSFVGNIEKKDLKNCSSSGVTKSY